MQDAFAACNMVVQATMLRLQMWRYQAACPDAQSQSPGWHTNPLLLLLVLVSLVLPGSRYCSPDAMSGA